MNKTLYVGPRQEAVWARAEVVALTLDVSLSALVARALGEFLTREPGPDGKAVEARMDAGSRILAALAKRVADLEQHAESMQRQIGEIATHLDLQN